LAWTIDYSIGAARQLRKLGKRDAKQILDYMDYRVAVAEDPRQFGKALVGDRSGYWRYRVEDFRILCQLIDTQLVVLVVEIGHRREVYR
jgi:mRNA interferase RelE/StbE